MAKIKNWYVERDRSETKRWRNSVTGSALSLVQDDVTGYDGRGWHLEHVGEFGSAKVLGTHSNRSTLHSIAVGWMEDNPMG